MKHILFYLLLSIIIFDNLHANENKKHINNQKIIKKYFSTNMKLNINLLKSSIRHYYKKEKYNLIWINDNNLSILSTQLINTINNDEIINLENHAELNLLQIKNYINIYNNLKNIDVIRLDFLLTNLYHKYMLYLSKGSINWKEFENKLNTLLEEDDINAQWEKYGTKVNKYTLLKESLVDNNITNAINKANYTFPFADKLYTKLIQYKKMSQTMVYIKLPAINKSLKPGMKSDFIPLIKERLLQSKDLLVVDTNDTTYDKTTVDSIRKFQYTHGLFVDGIIGKNTIKHLNISLKEKINTIRINLERMRWLPRSLGEKHILINIPDYKLKYYIQEDENLSLPIIVGTKKHPTPIFSHKIATVVLNPYWRIPTSIVQKEILPKLVANTNYLRDKDMNIHETWDENSTTYNSDDVQWKYFLQSDLEKENKIYPDIPFKFIQVPGIQNPLGKMKFLFRNKHMVYIHDTNERILFKKRQRAFSHGCIRLKDPDKLLEALSFADDKLDYNNAKNILKEISKTEIDLDEKIPIHIVYFTAWVDKNDNLHFRDDIYEYDRMQSEIMYKNLVIK